MSDRARPKQSMVDARVQQRLNDSDKNGYIHSAASRSSARAKVRVGDSGLNAVASEVLARRKKMSELASTIRKRGSK